MQALPEIFSALASWHGTTEKTEMAELLSIAARDCGHTGRRQTLSDRTVLAMQRGECNDDDRIIELVLYAVTEQKWIPLSRDLLNSLSRIDARARSASAVLSSADASQQDKEAALARARVELLLHHEKFASLLFQINDRFPIALAGGDEDSFSGSLWRAVVHFGAASAPYALYDVGDETRYRIASGELVSSEVVSSALEAIDAKIGSGPEMVDRLNEIARTFDRAAAFSSEAARRTSDHLYFCRYLEGLSRQAAVPPRSELSDIALQQRPHGGFCELSVKLATEYTEKHRQSVAHLTIEDRRARRFKDVSYLAKLRPLDHRPSRNGIYAAIKEHDVTAVKQLLPILKTAMNTDNVFTTVPARAPQTLRLVDEPALQAAFAANRELAQLAGWKAKDGGKAKNGGGSSLKLLLVALAIGAAAALGNWLSDSGFRSQPLSIELAARPGSERIG